MHVSMQRSDLSGSPAPEYDQRPAIAHLGPTVGLCFMAILAGLFLARAPLPWAMAMVSVAFGAVLLVRQPALALVGLACSIPFGSLYEIPLGGVTLGPSELLVGALAVTWAIRVMTSRQLPTLRSASWIAYLAFCGVLILCANRAASYSAAAKELLKWTEFGIVFAHVAGHCRKGVLYWVVLALLLAGIAEGLLGIYQFLFQVGPPGFVLMGRFMRAHGTFLQPNPFAGYTGLLLPTAYGLVLTTWRKGALGEKASPWQRPLLWGTAMIATGVLMAALIMSWSRGALLGMLAGGALVTLALGKRAGPAMLTVILIALLIVPSPLALLPTSLAQRLTGITAYVGIGDLSQAEINDENFAVIERTAHWIAAWRMFEMRPWLGVGTGQYATVYSSVNVPRWREPLGHAHNYYLNVLSENGLVGLAAYLTMMGAMGISVWRVATRATRWRRGLALGALGMLGHLLTHSLVDNLYVHEMYLLVAMLVAIAQAPGCHFDVHGRWIGDPAPMYDDTEAR